MNIKLQAPGRKNGAYTQASVRMTTAAVVILTAGATPERLAAVATTGSTTLTMRRRTALSAAAARPLSKVSTAICRGTEVTP